MPQVSTAYRFPSGQNLSALWNRASKGVLACRSFDTQSSSGQVARAKSASLASSSDSANAVADSMHTFSHRLAMDGGAKASSRPDKKHHNKKHKKKHHKRHEGNGRGGGISQG
jgi:hypothetical protein